MSNQDDYFPTRAARPRKPRPPRATRASRSRRDRADTAGSVLRVLSDAYALRPPGWLKASDLEVISGLPASTLGLYLSRLEKDGRIVGREAGRVREYRYTPTALPSSCRSRTG